VRLLRLSAGSIVKENTDPTLALEIEKVSYSHSPPIVEAMEFVGFLFEWSIFP